MMLGLQSGGRVLHKNSTRAENVGTSSLEKVALQPPRELFFESQPVGGDFRFVRPRMR